MEAYSQYPLSQKMNLLQLQQQQQQQQQQQHEQQFQQSGQPVQPALTQPSLQSQLQQLQQQLQQQQLLGQGSSQASQLSAASPQPSPLLLQYQQQQQQQQQLLRGAQPSAVGLPPSAVPKAAVATSPPQFAMIKIQENMDNILKYMKELDGRLTRLESSVGDLLRVYKAQELKLEEIRSLSKKATETPVVAAAAPSSYYTKPSPSMNNVSQPTNYGSPGFVPQPIVNPNQKAFSPTNDAKHKSQEQNDLALARELQAKFDLEATKEVTKPTTKASAPPTPTTATSECPICSKSIPLAQIEGHVAEHFDDDTQEPEASKSNEEPGFWGKIFGKKPPTKEAPKETKPPSSNSTANSSSGNTSTRSTQASPMVMAPPAQPTAMLAYPNAFYPGAPAPGYYPANSALPGLYPMQFTPGTVVLPPNTNTNRN